MDRLNLVRELLQECRLSADAMNQYFMTPRKYVEDEDLYMREVHFVVTIGLNGHPTMSELTHQLNVTQGAVTQMATRLEKKGYVLRQKDSADKRVTTVSLTEKGRRLCENHITYDRSEHASISQTLHEFSDEDLVRLIHFEQLIREIFINKK